ncbi:ATP-binding protein [Streptomyces sp. NPDC002133]|uniref:sensor histidine kinase n=1 Tax=Streptomyces sp. NPDC002133 TaxID=3154409 RepID=UPI003330460C
MAVGSVLVGRGRAEAGRAGEESRFLREQADRVTREGSHLVDVSLPSVTRLVAGGKTGDEALAEVSAPADPVQRQMLHLFAEAVAEVQGRLLRAEEARLRAAGEAADFRGELERLIEGTLAQAVGRLREGSSADRVLAGIDLPDDALLRSLTEAAVRELGASERRGAAARAASANSLSRVQARTVSMLADLRAMQDRHGEDVLGDLLDLDHSTSQLGLMTDRLALLMGGRPSRSWNRPIVLESILRGAVGRISAYQRVRLHCSSTSAVVGFAAEGVMHLLAELMDNAANFSPPIDEVHVYVEESSAGVVVTIEDSGLKMSEAAMRRAREAVAGEVNDLAALQGTRLGLAVVGRLAVKYGMGVSFRPSSRGGTGVVVLLPRKLIAQRPGNTGSEAAAAVAAPAPASARRAASQGQPAAEGRRATGAPTPVPAPATSAGSSAPAGDGGAETSTPGGLPVRAPGRTMATAHAAQRARQRESAENAAESSGAGSGQRDLGARFGAFHQARRTGDEPGQQAQEATE